MSQPTNHNQTETTPDTGLHATMIAVTATEAENLAWRPVGRGREEAGLCRDGVRVVARRWAPDTGSGLDIQGDEGGLVRVVSGIVEEERFLPDGDGLRYEVSVLKPGAESFIPRGGYRRIEAITQAVTLHAEAPKGKNELRPAELFAKLVDARRLRPRRRGGRGWSTRAPWRPHAA